MTGQYRALFNASNKALSSFITVIVALGLGMILFPDPGFPSDLEDQPSERDQYIIRELNRAAQKLRAGQDSSSYQVCQFSVISDQRSTARKDLIDQELDQIESTKGRNSPAARVNGRQSPQGVSARPESWPETRQTAGASEPAQRQEVPDFNSGQTVKSLDREDKLAAQNKRSREKKFALGTEFFLHNYEEDGGLEQDGSFGGLNASYTARIFEDETIEPSQDYFTREDKISMVRLEGMFGGGQVDFEKDGVGSFDDRRNFMFDVRAVAGYDFALSSTLRMTPYGGFGYRYLNDKTPGRLEPPPTSYILTPFSFTRELRYFYLPLGLEAEKRTQSGWSLTGTLEYDFLLAGYQINRYGDGGPRIFGTITDESDGSVLGPQWWVFDANKYQFRGGYGLRYSLQIKKHNDRIDFFMTPFVRYWNIQESDPERFNSTPGTEGWHTTDGDGNPVYIETHIPENETTEIGVKFGVNF